MTISPTDPATDAIAPGPDTAPSEPREPRRRSNNAVLIVAGVLLLLVVAAVKFGGYQIRPVLSGSMRPGLPVGGVVVTHSVPVGELKVRDVVVFHRPDDPAELVVHRIVTLTRHGSSVTVKTQGDANDTADPWTVDLRGGTAYRATFSVPLLGYPAVWLHSPDGRGELMMLTGLVIAIAAARMWRTQRRERTVPE